MSKKIDYTFDVDGFYDSVNYYRSETPMNPTAMPAPTATGISELAYSDTTAEDNVLYYVRFGSIRNSEEKISDEIIVSTYPFDPLDSYVVSLLRFENDLTDEKGNIWTARNASTYIDAGVLHVDATAGGLLCTNTNFLNFSTGAFCFETIVRVSPLNTSTSIAMLRNNWATWQSGAAIMSLESLKMGYFFYGGSLIIELTQSVTVDTFHHIAWARDVSGVMRMFLDGVMLRADSYPAPVNFSYWGTTLFQSGITKSKGVRITKGHARYTANFAPPSVL